MENKIIVAGSRPWNVRDIEILQSELPGMVVGVATSDELDMALRDGEGVNYIFFLHWSSIVPERITDSYECVCFHMTDVPFGRGGSPLQNLISRGIRETKMTALKMVRELDAGPIYLKRPLSLEGGTAEEIYMRASALSVEMIREIIKYEIKPVSQKGEVTVFSRRKPAESLLDGLMDLDSVHDHIRMLDAEGYPHAYLEVGGLKLEFRRSARYQDAVSADVRITQIEKE